MNRQEITNTVKENLPVLLRKKNLLFTIGNILIIIMLSFATYYGCKAKKAPVIEDDPITFNEEAFKAKIKNYQDQYIADLNKLYNEYKKNLETAGIDNFNFAKSNVDESIKQISSFKSCASLIVTIAKDKISKTHKTEEKIKDILQYRILYPCNLGSTEIQELTQNFLHKLQELDNNFRANCTAELNKLPKNSKNSVAAQNFVKNLTNFDSQVKNFIAASAFTAISTAIEAVLIRQTIAGIVRLTGHIVAKATGSAAAALVDGPLPIGDIIGAVGLGWCAYDIYKVTKVLPNEMRTTLNNAIDKCSNDARTSALEEATKAFNFCVETAEQTTQSVK